MKSKEIEKRLRMLGAWPVRQVGSHRRWSVEIDGVTYSTTVPVHGGDVPAGTLAAIQRQMQTPFGKGWLT